MSGRTETRTRDRIYCQTMRTFRDISRDNRARIATCSLRKLTDRLKANYSIDVQEQENFDNIQYDDAVCAYVRIGSDFFFFLFVIISFKLFLLEWCRQI